MGPKKEYVVIWDGREYLFNNEDDAITHAKMLITDEVENNRALLISRVIYGGDFPEVRITNVRVYEWRVIDYYHINHLM